MTNFLAIDTSSEACSIAISAKGKIKSFHEVSSVKHSERILNIIDELLDESKIKLNDLDMIACGVGPGSFTGIRLSCSIAQGLSYSLDLPLVAISSLLSMALQLNKSQNVDKICCLVNAHMNQIYVGKYEYSSGILDVSSETVINNSDFSFENLGLDDYYSFLGDGCSLVEIQPTEFVYPNSIAILELALKEFKQGNCVNPEELKPVYLSGEEHWSKA